MTAMAMKKTSSFRHAMTVAGLKTAFWTYDVARKHPVIFGMAVVSAGVGLANGARVATNVLTQGGDVSTALISGASTALVTGVGLFLGSAAIAAYPMSIRYEDAARHVREYFTRADYDAVNAYDKSREKQNAEVDKLLEEGQYREAVRAKICTLPPRDYPTTYGR